jgi:cephalosporin hydroxylase
VRQLCAPLVTPGSYLVVEDTNINGHPVAPDFGPGPGEALEDFLQGETGFAVDRECEKFQLTFNPRGYLRRS